MSTLIVLTKKDIMEQIRSKKTLILGFIFAFLAIASPITAKMMPEMLKGMSGQNGITINMPDPTYISSIDQYVKNTSQLICFLLIFIVAGAVADEKIKKTLELVLVKPVSRASFVMSKFIAYFLTISTYFLVASAIFYLYTVSIFGRFSLSNFVLIAFVSLVYILLIVSLTILSSTISKSAVAAGVVGLLGAFFFGSILGLFSSMAPYSPGYFISHYNMLLTGGWGDGFTMPTLVSVLLIIIFIFSAVRIFERQEIER